MKVVSLPEVSRAPEQVRPSTVLAFVDSRPWLTCFAAGILVIVLRSLFLPLLPIPKPAVHDEFSYLLGADTFASGRVTNPPHPMWVHFETFHVNQQPTYATKYPPAQSLFMALGQVLFGHPWFGVLLSVGLLFGAFCWMLQGWVTTRWLLLTLAMLAAELAFSGQMINSYWGGAVPALGGALIVGSLIRLARRPSTGSAVSAALGLLILGNSRPYEGALVAVGFFAALLFWKHRTGQPIAALLGRQLILPFLAIAVPGAVAMAYYNVQTTGSATVMPYIVNQQAYSAAPHIYITPPGPVPVYRHEVLRKLWAEWDRDIYLKVRNQPWLAAEQLVSVLFSYVMPEGFALALLIGVAFGWGIEVAALLLVAGLPMAALLLAKSVMPHYFAPMLGALVVLIALGLQACERIRYKVFNYPIGALMAVLIVGLSLRHAGLKFLGHLIEQNEAGPITRRDRVISDLEKQGGRHLILVRYGPNHDIHREWVYNNADIDGSTVVWARDMSAEQNQELLDYYKDRKVWLFQPDTNARRVAPYIR